MKFLSLEEILYFHSHIVMTLQGEFAMAKVLNSDQLRASVARYRQEVFGKEVHEGELSKAAALAQSLILGHPFNDGNKRAGITAACVFLMINGYQLKVTDDDIVDAALKTARGSWTFEDLRYWFESHSDKIIS